MLSEGRLIVDRMLVVGVAAFAAGAVMLAAGLAIRPAPVAGLAPVSAGFASDRPQSPVAVASLSQTSRTGPSRGEPVVRPPAPMAARPRQPFPGHDPARTDRGPRDVDYAPDDGRTFLKRMAARAHRRPYVDTADYPRSPQEELPLAARVGGDEAPAGAYHAIIAAYTASGRIDGGNDELALARRDDSP